MRGIVLELILFMTSAMGLILIISLLAMGVPGFESRIMTTEMREDIHTMGNALKMADAYSSMALKYSAYQACYDKLGALDVSLQESEFSQGLADEIGKNFRTYVSENYIFLSDYEVALQGFSVTVDSGDADTISLSASGEDLSIVKRYEGSVITLNRSSALSETVSMPCLGLYRAAKSAAETVNQSFETAAQQAVSGFPTPGVGVSGTVQTGGTCENLFNSMTGKSYAQANSDVGNSITTSVSNAVNGITGVEKSHSFTEEPNLEVSSTKTSEIVDPATGTALTCVFTYKITAKPEIVLTDNSKTFPVWNGTSISLEPLTAKFTISLDASPTAPPTPLTISDLVGEYTINIVVTEPAAIEGNYINTLTITEDGKAKFGDSYGTIEITGNRFLIKDTSIKLKDDNLYPIIFECIKTGEQISGKFRISYPQNVIEGDFIST